MRFSAKLKESIAHLNLLGHPFYQQWTEGTLPISTLQEYSKQYMGHVDASPRYISATHSLCDDLQRRQVLLENLIDEEKGAENHPELWRRFAEGLGVQREDVDPVKCFPESTNLVNTIMGFCRESFVEGLSALYAYEHQVPEIAQVKIDGLKRHYNVTNERALAFFEVHKKADEYHREACEKLLDEFTEEEQEKALFAAKTSAQALWDFLTGVQERTGAVTTTAC